MENQTKNGVYALPVQAAEFIRKYHLKVSEGETDQTDYSLN